MSHWAINYIGEPWIAGEHDCYAFARRVWREQFGMEVPLVDFDATSALACQRALAKQPERANWQPVETPREGDAVLISKGKRPSHVGVWISANGGAVLHCAQGVGVICQGLASLNTSGWHVLGYYRRGAA